jgi:hypothetical protein
MFTLANEALSVTLLDPVADQERFGVRYCTGGYIYQVDDPRHGPLLSGPTYPDSFNWFDGQGIPDAFNLSPLGQPTPSNPAQLVIGVGLCDLQDKRVMEFCQWEVQRGHNAIRMSTAHGFQGYALELERTVELHGRTVRAAASLRNTGELPIPLRWFPHPFFPQLDGDDALCRVNFPVRVSDDTWYTLDASGYIHRRGWPWAEGHFQALDHAAPTNLVIAQRHPALGLVLATCSYAPDFFPIWGNERTFSWEPFLERTVAGGQELRWHIDYDF